MEGEKNETFRLYQEGGVSAHHITEVSDRSPGVDLQAVIQLLEGYRGSEVERGVGPDVENIAQSQQPGRTSQD